MIRREHAPGLTDNLLTVGAWHGLCYASAIVFEFKHRTYLFSYTHTS